MNETNIDYKEEWKSEKRKNAHLRSLLEERDKEINRLKKASKEAFENGRNALRGNY